MNICFKLKRLIVSLILVLAVSFSALAQHASRKSVAEDLITIAYSSMEAPADLGVMWFEGWEMTDVAVKHYYACKSEEGYNSLLLKYGELKTNVIASWRELAHSSNAVTLLMFIDSDKDIEYNYSSPSGRAFSFTIYKPELLQVFGVNGISPMFREEVVKAALETSVKEAAAVGLDFSLNDINKKYISYKQGLDDCLVKGFKYNLAKETLNSFINGESSSVFPLYSIYLEKGYEYIVVDRVNKRTSKSRVSYEDLAFIYAYAMGERQKLLREQAALAASEAQAVKALEAGVGAQTAGEEAVPFQLVQVKPSFEGGDANNFSKWVNERLIYPEVAKEYGVQGRVTVQFTVANDGSVTNVKVLRGLAGPDYKEEIQKLNAELQKTTDEQVKISITHRIGELEGGAALDKEACRVVSMSPKWKPGKQRGKAVGVTYTFPVIFQLR